MCAGLVDWDRLILVIGARWHSELHRLLIHQQSTGFSLPFINLRLGFCHLDSKEGEGWRWPHKARTWGSAEFSGGGRFLRLKKKYHYNYVVVDALTLEEVDSPVSWLSVDVTTFPAPRFPVFFSDNERSLCLKKGDHTIHFCWLLIGSRRAQRLYTIVT